MKKILAILLVLAMMIAALASCTFGKNDGDGNDENTETEIPRIPFITAGAKTDYVIVYPDDSSDSFVQTVEFLVEELNSTYEGIEITCTPAMEKWMEISMTDKEILIGDTGREESDDALSRIKDNGTYIIKLYDSGKLVIAGNNESSLKLAINYFLSTYVYDTTDALKLEENLDFEHTDIMTKRDGWGLDVPSYWSGTLSESVYSTGTGLNIENRAIGGTMQVITDTNAKEFNDYTTSLKGAGYKQTASHTIGANQYAQFLLGDTLIYTYYTDSQKEVRVIHDRASTPENEFEYTYKSSASTTSTFYQYAMMYDPTGRGGAISESKPYENNGLFNVIKFADNSVMLVDGGWYTQATDDAVKALLDFLREITGTKAGEKVRIAAVYITHGHSDHIFFMKRLLELFPNDVIVERAMYNLPTNIESSEFDSFGRRLKAQFPNIKYAKLHTGQKIQLADVTFEVIYTHEDMVNGKTGTSEIIDFNNTSTILKMTMNGKTFMIMGDWGGNHTIAQKQETLDEYKLLESQLLDTFNPQGGTNYLKCDVVQISHHAINDWMSNVYAAIDPDVAFFPQQDVAYNDLAHVCYQNIVKHLRTIGVTDANMHFAGRYTYGMTVSHDGKMTLTSRDIAGADANYKTLLSKYSHFHAPKH